LFKQNFARCARVEVIARGGRTEDRFSTKRVWEVQYRSEEDFDGADSARKPPSTPGTDTRYFSGG
jgi:hypothetical protein